VAALILARRLPILVKGGTSVAKRALVLSGGGARGAYQVGMLQELVVNRGLDFAVFRGVSVGGLTATYLAQAPAAGDAQAALREQVQALGSLWLNEIKGNHSVYATRLGILGLVVGADSLYSLRPLEGLLKRHVNVDALRRSGRDLAIGTVSLVTGEYSEWKADADHFLEKLLASCAIPVVFPFVNLRTERDALCDGGVRNITPLASAFDAEPDEIYVLMTSPVGRRGDLPDDSGVEKQDYERWDDNFLGTKVNGVDVLMRTLSILTDEIYLDDIRAALKWNDVAKAVKDLGSMAEGKSLPSEVAAAVASAVRALDKIERRHVPLFVIAPRKRPDGEISATEFSPKLIREAIEEGCYVASHPELWVWPPVR
jgi:NTE family protein